MEDDDYPADEKLEEKFSFFLDWLSSSDSNKIPSRQDDYNVGYFKRRRPTLRPPGIPIYTEDYLENNLHKKVEEILSTNNLTEEISVNKELHVSHAETKQKSILNEDIPDFSQRYPIQLMSPTTQHCSNDNLDCFENQNIFSRIYQRIDKSRIRHFNKNKSSTYIRYIETVNWRKFRPSRAGVIVYTIYNNKLYFGLGIDTNSGDITDFGGGVRYKKYRDSNAVEGALREFSEESLCVFGSFTADQVQKCLMVASSTTMIIFLHIKVDINLVNKLFDYRVKSIPNSEMSALIWMTAEEFLDSIRGKKKFFMYNRVRNLLSSILPDNSNSSNFLKNL